MVGEKSINRTQRTVQEAKTLFRTRAITQKPQKALFLHALKPIALKHLAYLLVIGGCVLAHILQAQHTLLHSVVKPQGKVDAASLNRTERYLLSLGDDTFIQGSMYLEDDFRPGIMILKNGTVYRDLFYRYNVFSHKVQMLQGIDTLALIKPELVRFLKIGERTFVYDSIAATDSMQHVFFQLLSDGPVRLLVKHTSVFQPVIPYFREMHIGDEYDSFVLTKAYYVQEAGKPAIRVRKSIRSLVTALPNYEKPITNHCNLLDLNLRKESDLVRLFEALNH